jgi:hypothetical protein
MKQVDNVSELFTGGAVWMVKALEVFNDRNDPFGVKFEGCWSEAVQGQYAEYKEVIGEIYEKYHNVETTPEFRLGLMLVVSATTALAAKKAVAGMGLDNTGENAASNKVDAALEDPDRLAALRKSAEQGRLAENIPDDNISLMRKKQHIIQNEKAIKEIADYNRIKEDELAYKKMQIAVDQKSLMKNMQSALVLSEASQMHVPVLPKFKPKPPKEESEDDGSLSSLSTESHISINPRKDDILNGKKKPTKTSEKPPKTIEKPVEKPAKKLTKKGEDSDKPPKFKQRTITSDINFDDISVGTASIKSKTSTLSDAKKKAGKKR